MLKKIALAFSIAVTTTSSVYADNVNEVTENLSDAEKLYGLSLYWKEVSYNFAFFDQVPELDFDARYQEFIPRVLATENTYEYYRELKRLNALLQDGHTNIYYPKGMSAKYLDWPAVRLAEAGHQAIVTGVEKGVESVIPLGSVVVSVNGQDLQTYLKEQVMPYIASSTQHILWSTAVRDALDGKPDTTAEFTIETPDGKVKEVQVKRDARGRKIDYISITQPQSNGEPFELKWLDDDIAYVALNTFEKQEVVDQFKSHHDEIVKSKGLIIDLRFNNGGNSAYAGEIISYLADRILQGSVWKTPKHIAAYKAWGSFANQFEQLEKYRPYAEGTIWEFGEDSGDIVEPKLDSNHIVPTYVLIGRNTVSAAEDFLVYADSLEHFTTVGEPTYGSTGQPMFVDLPGGGTFRVCTKRDTFPDGREFVGYGIKPDILVESTLDTVRSDKDEVLERALNELRVKL
ncbi:S41 family peptidase [Microbulbifer sp. VTAC004]|uniref:S41 family peptidase n=1 Tax=Microbulbifer TaxID=48073 RepID=UPI000380A373|nr:S41 family peptidase [Microbulbifer variabilis]